MLDLLDLMSDVYVPSIAELDSKIKEISFLSQESQHETYTNINIEQLKLLRQNIYTLYKTINYYLQSI